MIFKGDQTHKLILDQSDGQSHATTIYIQQLKDNSNGIGLKPGFVPATTFWLVKQNSRILGESRLRHQLTPSLEERGGHIGYVVRPTERGKGYGTKLLAMTLEKTQQIGLDRVLVEEDVTRLWLRWCDSASALAELRDGQVIPTGTERADEAEEKAQKLAERLRAMGINPDEI